MGLLPYIVIVDEVLHLTQFRQKKNKKGSSWKNTNIAPADKRNEANKTNSSF